MLKKLVNSQEIYIQELESKRLEMDSEIKFWKNRQPEQVEVQEGANQSFRPDQTSGQDSSILADLVQKNQVLIQELQDKIKETEEEYEERLNQSEADFRTKVECLESENRVLKQVQEEKFTCEKDRINFHKTLRNNLLEEIERIEREQIEKEQNLAQWRQH